MNISWQAEMAIYRLGSKNVYGEAQLQFVRKTNVGVVKFEQSNEKSSVRADSSGSRGKANMELFDVVLVVPLEAAVQLDDVLILEGLKLKVNPSLSLRILRKLKPVRACSWQPRSHLQMPATKPVCGSPTIRRRLPLIRLVWFAE